MSRTYIAHGRTADIAPYGTGTVVKLFKRGFPRTAAEEEYRVSRLLLGQGIAVPQAYELVELDGRAGIVYEQIEGNTMLQAIGSRPTRCLAVSARMADVHADMHERTVGRALPPQKDALSARIAQAPYLTDEEKGRIHAELERLPDGDRLCHGDYHPDNVIVGHRIRVIDWMTAMSGHPAGDVMRTAILLKYGTIPEETPRTRTLIIAAIRRLMLHRYLLRYRQVTRMRMSEIEAWFLPVAAARLVEGIPQQEKELLLRHIRAKLKT